MTDKNHIQALVFQAIDRVNEVLLDDHTLAKDPATVLLGEGAQLDSMGFVNLVVAVDEAAAEKMDWNLSLAEALNAPGSAAPQPLTVAALVDFLIVLAEKRQ